MSIEADLQRMVREYGVKRVRAAGVEMQGIVQTDRRTPRDSGALAVGVLVGAPRLSGNVVEAEIKSHMTNSGFDYPAFIDKVAAVMPTRRKFLRWFGDSGPIFSRGFKNTHRGWWRKVVSQANWSKALKRAR